MVANDAQSPNEAQMCRRQIRILKKQSPTAIGAESGTKADMPVVRWSKYVQ
jgi:hypothetical protein